MTQTRTVTRAVAVGAAILTLALLAGFAARGRALAGGVAPAGGTTGLGQMNGLLPRKHLTLESAIQVNLSKESVRLPLYPGMSHGKKVWYVLLDSSDGA